MKITSVDVLIIGGGPAGLAAAIELKKLGIKDVRIIEREAQAGGVPRHSNHPGYGMRDLYRFMTGPNYAKAYVSQALSAGVVISTSTTATQWADDLVVELSGPDGVERVQAKTVVLATGARERARNARMIPGARPAGIYTTGSLQQAVFLSHLDIGTKAVIVGAEHVSFSALMTLSHAHVKTIAMLTHQSGHQSVPGALALSKLIYRYKFLDKSEIVEIIGSSRVSAIKIRDVHGNLSTIECDTIIFTGDWIPDNEMARRGSLVIDPRTKSPMVNTSFVTSKPGVFALGNILLPIKSADQCAVESRRAAKAIASHVVSVSVASKG